MLEVWPEFSGKGKLCDTEHVYLRGRANAEAVHADSLDCVDHAASTRVADRVIPTLRMLMTLLGVREFGQIFVTKLNPGGHIPAHTDVGQYASWYARFHLSLASPPECIVRAGKERVHMAVGELWWFNMQVEHSVKNAGTEPRYHLIFDCTAPSFTGALHRGGWQ
jgi:quercetin dioxygenase-like cupin family protein